MPKKKKPQPIVAKLKHRTLDRLVTLAARHAATDTDNALPVFRQIRLRPLGAAEVEAVATDRYTAGWFTAPLIDGQAWPAGLEVGLTVRQWHTVLGALRPARGAGQLDQLRTITVDAEAGTVTIEREKDPTGLEDTVNSLTFPIPGGQFPNIDNLRTLNPADVEPLPLVALNGRLLARLPREFGLIVAKRHPLGVNGPDPQAARPVHVLGDDWHVAIMSGRLADSWAPGRPGPTIPAKWAQPTDPKENA